MKTTVNYLRLLIIFLILFPIFLSPENSSKNVLDNPLIEEITLVDRPNWIKKKKRHDFQSLPNQLLIGIKAKKKVFFKLSSDNNKEWRINVSGALVRGQNKIVIETAGLFNQSGNHSLLLTVKHERIIQRFLINLDITMDFCLAEKDSTNEIILLHEQSADDEKNPNIYEISILAGNKLIQSSQIKNNTFSRLLNKGKQKPAPIIQNPLYSISENRGPALTLSPLSIIAMALKKRKQQKSIRQRKKIIFIYLKQINEVIFRKRKDGKKEKVEINIKINHQLLRSTENTK